MKITTLLTATLSLLVIGCGGSGSGNKNTGPSSSVSSPVATTSIAASFLVSSVISSQQASSPAPVLKGIFLDAAVGNIGYRTSTQEGFTNANGEFNYRPGELITFFIGGTELPKVMASDIITPLDIANTQNLNDNQLINILRLLQSLDADSDASNGIEIADAAIAAGTLLDFTLAPEVFAQLPAVQTLLQAANKELISTEQAVAHFQTTLEFINGPAVSSASSSSINNSSIGNSSASSDDIIVVPGSSAASSDALETSSSAHSNSSASSASEQANTSSDAGSSSSAATIIFSENFNGATASNFYSTYRVNSSGVTFYKKSGGTPVFENGTIKLNGARFTIGETGKDLDLSKPYVLSFDVVQASGTGKVQIFVDNASTSGDKIFNESANTLTAGQRFVLRASEGTAKSFIQIRAESSATLALDNLVIEQSGAIGNSSSNSSSTTSSENANSSVGNTSSANSSITISSSSSSAPYIPVDVNLSADCISLTTNPAVNWRDTALQTDQEIVACLYQSLGRPVGYGENAQGGYDPAGNSKLTIITKNSPVSIEQQLLNALTDNAHNWVVFDKLEFANEYEIGMYRTHCSNPAVLSILDASEAECIDYHQWCSRKGVTGEPACRTEFFNKAMNNKNIPIRIPPIGSHKTVDGRMSKAYFLFSGFAIGKDYEGSPTQTAESVIFTHLDFRGAGHTEDHYVDPDMIRSTGASKNIWIHKNTFDTTGDSAFDVKVGAHNITMSFNRLVNVKRAVLHGSSDSHTIDKQITTTMHHNAFVTTDDSYMLLGNTLRRVPLLRHGKTHMFNNVFVNYRKEVLSARVGASVLLEDNAFVTNISHKEKSSLENSLNEILSNLIKDDAISGGSNLRNERNFFWFGNAACVVDETTKRQLTQTAGSVADLSQHYNAASLNTINGWRFAAGQDLIEYVTLTAGKLGDTPFNSPMSPERAYMEGLSPAACQ